MDDATLLLWLDKGRTLAYLLVALGVVGEFLIDRISGPVIKRRDDAQRAEIAKLNKEAGEARQAASGAMERIAEAQEETAKASAQAAAANERAARLEKEAAELKDEAEKERLARIKIEERLAPRALSPEQTENLKSGLVALKGKSLTLQFISGIPEIAVYADSLAKVLTQAGLKVDRRPVMILGDVQSGFTMNIGTKRMADAKILAEALKNAGLITQAIPAQELKDQERINDLELVVGPK